jgi:hypothetical protein
MDEMRPLLEADLLSIETDAILKTTFAEAARYAKKNQVWLSFTHTVSSAEPFTRTPP